MLRLFQHLVQDLLLLDGALVVLAIALQVPVQRQQVLVYFGQNFYLRRQLLFQVLDPLSLGAHLPHPVAVCEGRLHEQIKGSGYAALVLPILSCSCCFLQHLLHRGRTAALKRRTRSGQSR